MVRFAGDSGDGIQLTGAQFTQATALAGNDLDTFPDFPAEIRAPVGTTFGVSAFQIHFGARRVYTIGDSPDLLVALNPAALKTNISDVRPGGIVIVDAGSFDERSLKKAGLATDPRHDGSLDLYRVIALDLSANTKAATKHTGLSTREQLRCKNFYALGLVYWMFERDRAATVRWLEHRFKDHPAVAAANVAALNAGHALGETAEIAQLPAYHVGRAATAPGLYRTITGHEALAFGLLDGARKAELKLVFCSYPITPASALLHHLGEAARHGRHHFPGRGRDRRRLRRHRRLLRRQSRRHRQLRPRHRAQDRGDRACCRHRAAAGDRQRPARRPVDRPADQD